jgi:hypothetical protein
MSEFEPLLPYDTGAMRTVAIALRVQSLHLGQLAGELSGASGGLVFDGPAGDRVKSSLGDYSRTLAAVSQQLGDAAAKMLASADDVDSQNAAIEAHNASVLAHMPPMERKLLEYNR